MSLSLSATGWSAGRTLLAAFAGSAAGGVEAIAGTGDAGAAVVAGSLVSPAGAVATSAGLVSVLSGVLSASGLSDGGTAAVESILKSLMVGGGTLAGSGRGIAASIASSAALLRGGAVWASAEVTDTVRKVAATAISTRSNPARFFEQSRIVAPLARNCPGMEQFLISSAQLFVKAPALSVQSQHSGTSLVRS